MTVLSRTHPELLIIRADSEVRVHPNRITKRRFCPSCVQNQAPSQQIKIIQLLPILENIPLHLTAIHPRDEILHVPRHQEGGIRYDLGAYAHVPLLHESHRRRHVLGHVQARHEDGEAPAGEARDAHFALHVAEFDDEGGEDAHVVEFFDQEFFVLEADGVGGGEVAEGVG